LFIISSKSNSVFETTANDEAFGKLSKFVYIQSKPTIEEIVPSVLKLFSIKMPPIFLLYDIMSFGHLMIILEY
jgi:hypothetical protein